jgi:hypothetical protein
MNQVINAPISREEKALFNSVFSLVQELSVETLRNGKVRTNEFEEYKVELNNSGRSNKRVIVILGWEVSVVNYNFIKSNCPHMNMMLRDAVKVLKSHLVSKDNKLIA